MRTSSARPGSVGFRPSTNGDRCIVSRATRPRSLHVRAGVSRRRPIALRTRDDDTYCDHDNSRNNKIMRYIISSACSERNRRIRRVQWTPGFPVADLGFCVEADSVFFRRISVIKKKKKACTEINKCFCTY